MRILLAVSGGIDSMYLAHRASVFFPESSFGVAHCNFHLRGCESDEDAIFVREWSEGHSIPFHYIDFDTSAYSSEKGVSIEMAARDLRYSWFHKICIEEGYDAVAVAHNANDNAETLILNLLRGTGSRGLCGMDSDSRLEIAGAGSPLRILRPMLRISREEINRWMTDNGCSWREDRTNAESIYKRNKVRNNVFPLFEEINPAFLKILGRDMEHFSQVNSIADDFYRETIAGCTKGEDLDLGALLKRRHWEYALWRWLEPYRLSEETFEKLVELLRSGRTISGKTFESPSHIISIHKKYLSVSDREK